MAKLGMMLAMAAGMALVGCSGTKPLNAPTPSASVAVPTPSASVSSPAPTSIAPTSSVPSVPPVPSASGSLSSALPTSPLTTRPPTTTRPTATSAPRTEQESAFLAQLKTLSVTVTDEPSTVAQGHKVCSQFDAHLRYDQVANSISGYDPDDARNLMTAAVLTLCPQYKNLVGG